MYKLSNCSVQSPDNNVSAKYDRVQGPECRECHGHTQQPRQHSRGFLSLHVMCVGVVLYYVVFVAKYYNIYCSCFAFSNVRNASQRKNLQQ